MVKYHLSPVTGKMEKCSAVKRPCRYGGKHYPSEGTTKKLFTGMVEDTKDQGEVKAKDPNTPVEVLVKLAEDPEPYVRTGVAGNPNTPVEDLIRLANDPDGYVRMKVARNPNTPGEVLVKLAEDPDVVVRIGIAWNQNTSAELLNRLATDPQWYVREGVAQNLNTPGETLLLLTGDEDRRVIKTVKDNPLLRSWGIRL